LCFIFKESLQKVVSETNFIDRLLIWCQISIVFRPVIQYGLYVTLCIGAFRARAPGVMLTWWTGENRCCHVLSRFCHVRIEEREKCQEYDPTFIDDRCTVLEQTSKKITQRSILVINKNIVKAYFDMWHVHVLDGHWFDIELLTTSTLIRCKNITVLFT